MAAGVTAGNDFVAKLFERQPQWQLAAPFIPAAQQALWFDYLALQNEWLLAQALPDDAPRVAKLSWWAEELRGWSKGMRRHPLGQLLQPASGQWDRVADVLGAQELRLDELAEALSEVDRDLLGTATPTADLRALLKAEMAQIQGINELASGSSRLPRLRALQRAVQHCVAAQKPLSPLRTVLICWRAARKSR